MRRPPPTYCTFTNRTPGRRWAVTGPLELLRRGLVSVVSRNGLISRLVVGTIFRGSGPVEWFAYEVEDPCNTDGGSWDIRNWKLQTDLPKGPSANERVTLTLAPDRKQA